MSTKPVSFMITRDSDLKAYMEKIWDRFIRFVDTQDRELCGQPEDSDVDGKRHWRWHKRRCNATDADERPSRTCRLIRQGSPCQGIDLLITLASWRMDRRDCYNQTGKLCPGVAVDWLGSVTTKRALADSLAAFKERHWRHPLRWSQFQRSCRESMATQ